MKKNNPYDLVVCVLGPTRPDACMAMTVPCAVHLTITLLNVDTICRTVSGFQYVFVCGLLPASVPTAMACGPHGHKSHVRSCKWIVN
jgi:hypothetical protein